MAKEITAQHITAIRKNLTEFGYPGLTDEFVKSEVDKVLAGEPTGIIGKFAKGMLEEAGLIEDQHD